MLYWTEEVAGISKFISVIIIPLIIGLIIGYLLRKYIAESKIKSAEDEAKKLLVEAEKNAETKKKELLLEAKDEVHQLRTEFDKESKDRRNELQRLERRLLQREELLDKKEDNLNKRDEALNNKKSDIHKMEENVQSIYNEKMAELEKISGMTQDQAKQHLLNEIKDEVSHEATAMVKEIENNAKLESEKKAREIVTSAIQRCAVDQAAETTVSVVTLPNDEMKGRIIGREGRNIRTLETLTGVDLIIDDTPEAVILSGFDSIRREVARIALEKLISDGRIHPARIEEMVDKARKEMDNKIREEGEQAAFDTGVHGLHPELIKLLGKLKYRTSYGQNVLKHSVEVAQLAALMASEIGADVNVSKRAGLLHDIGKAVDQEMEGSHAAISTELAKTYHEAPGVVHAIEAHHNDIEPRTVEAVLVQAADAISASRPGARKETLEAYIKRLEKLEDIANSFEGVEKSYAIQAGREIRIIVKPDEIDDLNTFQLARDIVKKVETELEYPGQIKVNVIRETRAIEYAK